MSSLRSRTVDLPRTRLCASLMRSIMLRDESLRIGASAQPGMLAPLAGISWDSLRSSSASALWCSLVARELLPKESLVAKLIAFAVAPADNNKTRSCASLIPSNKCIPDSSRLFHALDSCRAPVHPLVARVITFLRAPAGTSHKNRLFIVFIAFILFMRSTTSPSWNRLVATLLRSLCLGLVPGLPCSDSTKAGGCTPIRQTRGWRLIWILRNIHQKINNGFPLSIPQNIHKKINSSFFTMIPAQVGSEGVVG